MGLQELLKNDLREIAREIGQSITIEGKGGRATLNGVLSDATETSAGYAFADGQSVSATCTVDGDLIGFPLYFGDKVTTKGIRYRISGITRTHGDSAISLSLVVEGRNV